MKNCILILMMALWSCTPSSSHERGSRLRDERLQQQVDSLIKQQNAILDTLSSLKKAINERK